MSAPLLTTKLYIPPPRPTLVSRPRLIERLNAGHHRKLTLVTAPAGFGKTTLLSEWASQRVGGPLRGFRWMKVTMTPCAFSPISSPRCRRLPCLSQA